VAPEGSPNVARRHGRRGRRTRRAPADDLVPRCRVGANRYAYNVAGPVGQFLLRICAVGFLALAVSGVLMVVPSADR